MADLVSVVMATRNRAACVRRALASIQRQTYRDLEILVLDDGSTDHTLAVLEQSARHDPRIRIFHNEASAGLASALNRLIAASRGVYLARMDDDDLAYPQRIERQVAWLEANNLDVCGTWYRRVAGWRRSVMRPPTEPESVRAELLFQPPLLHPSVLMRKATIERFGGYSTDYPHAEDYELWARLALDCRLGNVPQVLMDYTNSPRQTSNTHKLAQFASAQRIREAFLQRLAVAHTEDDVTRHSRLRAPYPIETLEELAWAGAWLTHLSRHFSAAVGSVFARQWFLCAVRAAGLGPQTYRLWAEHELAVNGPVARKIMLRALCTARLRYRSAPYRWLELLASG